MHCIHSLAGGGAERQLKLLVEEGCRHDIESAIFCVNDHGNDLSDPAVRVYKCARANKYNFSIFSSLNHALHDFKPDIVHAWLPQKVTTPALLLAWLHGIPSIYSFRNTMYFHRFLCVPDFLVALGFGSRVVANNPVYRSNFLYRQLYRLKRGIEIRNAVHVDRAFGKTAQMKAADDPYRILFVGRIWKQKNWECLIRALPLIEPRHKWELMICGKGEQQPLLEKALEDGGMAAKVKLLGYRADIYSVMQSADVLVSPSWYEGMPNVLMEALSIGLPSIISDIPAHKDVITDTSCALTFDPASPEELAARINYLFDNPKVGYLMAEKGREVAAAYSVSRMAARYKEFYDEVMRETGKGKKA